MRSGPSLYVTASRCGGFRSASKSIGSSLYAGLQRVKRSFPDEVLVERQRVMRPGFPYDQEAYLIHQARPALSFQKTLRRRSVQHFVYPSELEDRGFLEKAADRCPAQTPVQKRAALHEDVGVHQQVLASVHARPAGAGRRAGGWRLRRW